MQEHLYQFLDRCQIEFQRLDHPPVFTCEEATRYCPELSDFNTKNLFLRDRKGKRHFLVVTDHHRAVDLKSLGELMGAPKPSFGSPDRLRNHLGVEPGSVTILSLINDPEHRVELFIDRVVWDWPRVACHPLVNTSTLVLSGDGIRSFLKATGHEPAILDLPVQG